METLADRIAREGPINELDAVGWAVRLAKRLEVMHGLGVIHGSVSPSSILIEATDRATRARLLDVRQCPSSLACQSPERVRGGGPSQVDDTWALACTLYAILTGNLAFEGADDAEVERKILSSAPAPLAVFDVGDDDLQRIIDEALSRDVRQRITSVATLRQALEEWHPDPNVGALPAIEDDSAGPAGFIDDEDDADARTLMRSAPAALAGHLHRSSAMDEDEDEDADERTAMRVAQPPSPTSSSATRSGAFTVAAPRESGAFPAAGAPLPDPPDDPNDDAATLMRPSPFAETREAEDDDADQKTLMQPSAVQPSAVQPSPVQPSPVQPSPAQPSLTQAVQPPPSRRMGLWVALAALLLAAGVTFFLLQVR